jgi:hypothetical protein
MFLLQFHNPDKGCIKTDSIDLLVKCLEYMTFDSLAFPGHLARGTILYTLKMAEPFLPKQIYISNSPMYDRVDDYLKTLGYTISGAVWIRK